MPFVPRTGAARLCCRLAVVLCLSLLPPVAGAKSRTFLFTYSATVTALPPGKTARIWLPIPPDNADQHVAIVSQHLPVRPRMTEEPRYRNALAYMEAVAGEDGTIPLNIVYRVTRREVGESKVDSRDESDRQFLAPDALVPVGGPPMILLAGRTLPSDQMELGRMLYDVVLEHMEYRKDRPGWGRGDAVWACASGFGNCTDFHSLFISLARSEGIPSIVEMGFPVPRKPGPSDVPGYHCWAKFKPAGHAWVPVDISDAKQNPDQREYDFGHLSEDRVAFSVGRDLVLVPAQSGPPVNFLIYPYVEIDGQPYPQDRIDRHFSCEDVQSDGQGKPRENG